jgi:hypothetical protein
MTPITLSPPGVDLEPLAYVDLSQGAALPLSLEDRMTSAYAKLAQESAQQHQALMRAASDPRVTSNPELLYQQQTQLSEYVIKMSLASTLARKAVSCVETLIKAQ